MNLDAEAERAAHDGRPGGPRPQNRQADAERETAGSERDGRDPDPRRHAEEQGDDEGIPQQGPPPAGHLARDHHEPGLLEQAALPAERPGLEPVDEEHVGRHSRGLSRAVYRERPKTRALTGAAGVAMAPPFLVLDPCLSEADAERLLDLLRGFGAYAMYVQGATATTGLGAGLVRRHDALLNYVKEGYASGAPESMEHVGSRTNLFRGVLAEGSTVRVPGSEGLLYHHEPFLSAARALTGLALVVPDMLYANLMLPGQELPVHTDTPEYRGLSKADAPEWFLVVMMHSGLFEDWRVRIAGGVTFLRPPREGGAFVVYPEGRQGPAVRVGLRHNTSVMLDADALFHGVDRVGGPDAPAPSLRPHMTLRAVDDDTWEVRDGERPVARLGWGELRLSLQWKALCFADEAARARYADHTDDLTLERALDGLIDDLRARGVVRGERPSDDDLGLILIDTYIRFPTAAAM